MHDLTKGRCLTAAFSHAILGNQKNSLALLDHALHLSSRVSSPDEKPPADRPMGMEVTQEPAKSLQDLLRYQVTRKQALVQLENIKSETIAAENARSSLGAPWIEGLDEYPANGVDLANLVVYPPRLRPVPVKPIFLDVAWNYVDYPRAEGKKLPARDAPKAAQAPEKTETKKSGWFGFGR